MYWSHTRKPDRRTCIIIFPLHLRLSVHARFCSIGKILHTRRDRLPKDFAGLFFSLAVAFSWSDKKRHSATGSNCQLHSPPVRYRHGPWVYSAFDSTRSYCFDFVFRASATLPLSGSVRFRTEDEASPYHVPMTGRLHHCHRQCVTHSLTLHCVRS